MPQPISFTCAPHLQLCLSLLGDLARPLGSGEDFDPLAECPGAAQALADAFDGFDYSTIGRDHNGGCIVESAESFDIARVHSNVPPRGFEQLACCGGSDGRYFWALYSAKKIGVACMSGVSDRQRFRLVWWFPTEGGSPTWEADWLFSQDYHVARTYKGEEL